MMNTIVCLQADICGIVGRQSRPPDHANSLSALSVLSEAGGKYAFALEKYVTIFANRSTTGTR